MAAVTISMRPTLEGAGLEPRVLLRREQFPDALFKASGQGLMEGAESRRGCSKLCAKAQSEFDCYQSCDRAYWKSY
jgi:hypothetical protein